MTQLGQPAGLVRAQDVAAADAAPRIAGERLPRWAGLPVAVLCLLLALRVAGVIRSGIPGEVPFTIGLLVIPLLCASSRTRRVVARYRWPALAVQAALTWGALAVFGDRWQIGIGGLLAGLVLLLVPGRLAWPLAAALLAAEVAVRVAVTGLPAEPAWVGFNRVVTYYVDDALAFFGIVRLAQIVGEVEQARGRAAEAAGVAERLRADRELQSAIGRHLDEVMANAAQAREDLARDAVLARARIAAAGVAARNSVARARAVGAGDHSQPGEHLAASAAADAVIGARLARWVLVTTLLMYAVAGGSVIVVIFPAAPAALDVIGIAAITALQVYHSAAVHRGDRPVAWPVTLALQAMVVYAFVFPFVQGFAGSMAGFLAGSVLLLVPGWWRWAGYAAVAVSWPALLGVRGLLGDFTPAGGQPVPSALFVAVSIALVGLLVYGLARLARLAAELERLRGELARGAAVRERLRITRDVHDMLGMGLSAIALKTDLIGLLIGHDDAGAAAELGELARICAAARADTRLVAAGSQQLTLARELAAARQILASAGLEVSVSTPDGPVPAAADEVLAPVLREAVTNILRHSTAAACEIDITNGGGMLRMRVGNDGVDGELADSSHPGPQAGGGREGRGIANLTSRVAAAGGRLTRTQEGGRFDLAAEIPLPGPPG
jgi:two-component system sensor histidine kinase DesK